jgi:flagellar hook-associated protein FlgK
VKAKNNQGDTMGLTDKREKLLKELPIIKPKVSKSKDGKYLIHKTEIVHIKPMKYYEAILDNNVKITEDASWMSSQQRWMLQKHKYGVNHFS